MHLQHVHAVFKRLRDLTLALKKSKCSFGAQEVAYLGQVFSTQGVTMDAKKIEAMQAWPQPWTMRMVRGFLGLTGYYRKFIWSYNELAAPLT